VLSPDTVPPNTSVVALSESKIWMWFVRGSGLTPAGLVSVQTPVMGSHSHESFTTVLWTGAASP
jgi:hypothetical protein